MLCEVKASNCYFKSIKQKKYETMEYHFDKFMQQCQIARMICIYKKHFMKATYQVKIGNLGNA